MTLSQKEIKDGAGLIKQYSAEETYPLHTHTFYEIVFIARGKGIHCVNDRQQVLADGSLVLIRPWDVHSFRALNYFDFEIFSLGFLENELQSGLEYLEISADFLTSPELPLHLVLNGSDKVFLEQQLERMFSEQDPVLRKQIFKVILQQVFYHLMFLEKNEKEVLPDWLSRLDEEMSIQKNYVEGLPQMLRICHYSQEYLNRMFRKYFHMTPTEYINAKRMIYAAELLMTGKYEIIEVCEMVGFCNLSYFYAVFKKQYGCTPYRFTKSFSGKQEEDKGVFL